MSNETGRICGYVNGKPVHSTEEFVYASRGFGPIQTDEELLAFAEKVTGGWYCAGWNRTFTTYYLNCAPLRGGYPKLTKAEFDRLVELQKKAREAEEAADKARCWKLVETYHYADNSTEEVWEDKDGVRKTVMTVSPHGDLC